MEEKDILRLIRGIPYYEATLSEIRQQLDSICYKTTPTYGNLAPAAASGVSSKVENMGNRRHELKQKEAELKDKRDRAVSLIECSGLDTHEKGILWAMARGDRLQRYAAIHNIGRDNVYKIRDRAINKIIKLHNVA